MLKKVVVVDDDPDVLSVMEEILTYVGFTVNTFECTKDILSIVKQHRPDLLIVDYILGEINGGELCKTIKSHLYFRKLPVIIISAYPKLLQSSGTYGCDIFMAKPFDLSDLLAQVEKLIGSPKISINTFINRY